MFQNEDIYNQSYVSKMSQRVNTAGVKLRENLRDRLMHQKQSVNDSFYKSLRANTVFGVKNLQDSLISNHTAPI